MMAPWSFWTEEAEPKANAAAEIQAWVTGLDGGGAQPEEHTISFNSNLDEAIEES